MRSKLITCSLLLAATSCVAFAAPARRPAAKPAPKPAAKPAPKAPSTPFGAMLPGDKGELGKLYLFGKAPNRWLCSVQRAEFSVGVMPNGNDPMQTEANQKLLVLHWTVQNPEKETRPVDWGMFKFTAVDPQNENHESQNTVLDPQGVTLSMDVKPTQKIAVMTTVVLPAAGEVPKLMMSTAEEADGVLRFDLRGKVKPLPTGLADPADKTGATALEEVAGQQGILYPTGLFEVRLDGVTESKEKEIAEMELGEANRWVVFAATLRNSSDKPQQVDWGTIPIQLVSSAGSEVDWDGGLVAGAEDEKLSLEVPAGKEVKVRYFCQVPAKRKLDKIMLRNGDAARRIVFVLPK